MFSCSFIPKGVSAVHPFDKDKYLGKWYEIARKDYRFERNLKNVTAEYSFREDGKIKVLNKDFNTQKNKASEVEGKAKFRGADTVAALKVSFFGPFYSGYNVIAIDKDYKYAMVAGKNFKYLWLLSREPSMPENIKNDYLQTAWSLGFKTTDLIWVKHD